MRKLGLGNAVWAAVCAALITACGGGGNTLGSGGSSSGGTSSGGTSSGGTSSGGPTPTPVLRMGVLNGTTFTPGVISIGTSPLDAGGSSGLRVDIVDTANNNTPVTSSVTVTFSSACISAGTAQVDSPVIAATGSATSNYRAQGCSGNDTITASTTIGGTSLSATGVINVRPSPVGSITFLSTSPTAIRLRGSGQPDSAVVTFEVKNVAGGPVEGQDVNFTLDTTVGGITLSPTTGKTDSRGRVQTTVNSGSVATAVRVTATTGVAGIPPAQSESLVISTGLADQDSFSMSIGCFNIEGDSYDGEQTSVNILAADRFNNPVPDGTAVQFRAEGGSIQSQCLTVGGACSVQFTTQNPRVPDHRVTILAAAIGEESFTDLNGNGRFNAGEPFIDVGEAFLDTNFDGVRQAASEPFLDFNSSGSFNGASGNFTGVLCDSGCDSATSLHVRQSVEIIMSGSDANITLTPTAIDLTDGPVSVRVLVQDGAGQVMPGGTTISASTTTGVIEGEASRTQPCTNAAGPSRYDFVVGLPTIGQPNVGTFTLKVTTPNGNVTTRTASVSFNTTTPPPDPDPPPAVLGQLRFVAANPTTIGLRGTGIQETSTVTFQVLTAAGEPIENQPVSFTLDTSVGDISLSNLSAVSDAGGLVTTIVRSGTIHTSVRVRAFASQDTDGDGTVESTEPRVDAASGSLTITTGIPDQDSFSLAVACPNVEAWDIDGRTTSITARLADRFNNPAPDGTAVAFTAEGGAVGGSCNTVDGACTVSFVGQNPRPSQNFGSADNGPRNGRSTILASALGEESFIDLDGDGQFDDGEPFANLPEAFRDDNADGGYNSTFETFLDFNRNGVRDAASTSSGTPTFTGILCNGPNTCERNGSTPVQQLHVRQNNVVIMSGSRPVINDATDVSVTTGGSFTPSSTSAPSVLTLNEGATAFMTFVVRDLNDQPMPAGTTVFLNDNDATANTQIDVDETLVLETSCQFDDSAAGNRYTFPVYAFRDSDGLDESATLQLEVTTPSGVKTSIPYVVNVIDNDTPDVALTASVATISEAGGTVTVTATLSAPTDSTAFIDLGFAGAATRFNDFNVSSATISIPSGAVNGSVTLTALEDTTDEPDEAIVIDIIDTTNAAETTNQQVTVTITDND